MATWDDAKAAGGGMNLLPEGTREYKVTKARVEISAFGRQLRELVVGLSSSEGSGEVSVPLEPFLTTPDGVELWESIFKSAAMGLGFAPSNGQAPMLDVANEFAGWVPTSGLVGSTVEATVKHVNSTKLKDDGTPFVNHRVTFRGVVTAGPTPEPAAPAFAGAGAVDADDPWA